jgi:hypothetical protein
MIKEKSWSDRLAEAKQQGFFTEEDCIAAEEWTTCAVGEKTHSHHFKTSSILNPRMANSLTFNNLIQRLTDEGMEFMHAVQEGHKCTSAEFDQDLAKEQVNRAAGLYNQITTTWNEAMELLPKQPSRDFAVFSDLNWDIEHEHRNVCVRRYGLLRYGL